LLFSIAPFPVAAINLGGREPPNRKVQLQYRVPLGGALLSDSNPHMLLVPLGIAYS
jgi:hypothetical protein